MGDFGTGEQGQYKVSKLLNYLIENINVNLYLDGDNIYPDGVTHKR